MENTILTKLNSTEDALKFGKNASRDDVELLKTLREMCGKEVKRLMKVNLKDPDNEESLNLAMEFGVKAQFCREAIEVSKL